MSPFHILERGVQMNNLELLLRLAEAYGGMKPVPKLVVRQSGDEAIYNPYTGQRLEVNTSSLPELFERGCLEFSNGSAATRIQDGIFILTNHGCQCAADDELAF